MRNLIVVFVLLLFTVGLAGCGGQSSAQETDATSTSNYYDTVTSTGESYEIGEATESTFEIDTSSMAWVTGNQFHEILMAQDGNTYRCAEMNELYLVQNGFMKRDYYTGEFYFVDRNFDRSPPTSEATQASLQFAAGCLGQTDAAPTESDGQETSAGASERDSYDEPLGAGLQTLWIDGQAGSFRLNVTTEDEIREVAGRPDEVSDVQGIGPNNPIVGKSLSYSCGTGCSTEYILSTKTGRLADVYTTSPQFATQQGTRVGMSTAEAERREGKRVGRGCISAIALYEQPSNPDTGNTLFITGERDRITYLSLHGRNSTWLC